MRPGHTSGFRPKLTVVGAGAPMQAPQDFDWAILMARGQEGDQAAYRRLLIEITPYLRALAARQLFNAADIEDGVQDILLTLHTIRHTYDKSRPFGPWLATIAQRRLIDRLRKTSRNRKRETTLTEDHEQFVDGNGRDEPMVQPRSLAAAIASLPVAQQQAIHLLKLQELSLNEAALKTGMSVGALKIATHRAMKSLRALLTPGRDQ
ncbi:MAG: sigma-70 family RNA polymerase sigma factor [Hyphomicrobiales bacterium]|nr:sigma-70 family RNA polymerase sigma factor [Hyphomicrobiales bacterium]MDE2115731.1 sigma-70 family RNA polymerase sigma factor [Hyphomicrobiales bacterium]